MSLIIDALKKLRKGNKESKENKDDILLPPNLKNEDKTRNEFLQKYKKLLILTGLVVIVGIISLLGLEFLKQQTEQTYLSDNYQRHKITKINTNINTQTSQNKTKNKVSSNLFKNKEKNILEKTNKEKSSLKNIPDNTKKEKNNLKNISNKTNEKATILKENNTNKINQSSVSSNNKKVSVNSPLSANNKKVNKTPNQVSSNTLQSLPPPILNKKKKITGSELWQHIYLADSYVRNNQIEKAIKEYEFVLNNRFYDKVASNLVYLLIVNGDIEKLQQAISKYKIYEKPKIFTKTVALLIKFQKFSTAEEILNKYCQKNQKYLYLYLKGLFYEKTGHLKDALTYYEKAYKIRPNDSLIAYSYARILDIKGNYEKAVNIYKEILSLNISENLRKIVKNRIKVLDIYGIR